MLDVFPLPRGSYYRTSPFGTRTDPLGRGVGFHGGVDLAAPHGTPIYAVVDGLLNQAWDPGGGGNWTNLWADDGSRYGYGHAAAFYDPDGAGPATSMNGRRVTAGQVIAYVGTTGGSTGDHLHFAWDAPGPPSSYVDPEPLLREAENAGRFADGQIPQELDMPLTDADLDKLLDRLAADEPRADLVRAKFANKAWWAVSGQARAEKAPGFTDGRAALDEIKTGLGQATLAIANLLGQLGRALGRRLSVNTAPDKWDPEGNRWS